MKGMSRCLVSVKELLLVETEIPFGLEFEQSMVLMEINLCEILYEILFY